jgi:hypothetical protein
MRTGEKGRTAIILLVVASLCVLVACLSGEGTTAVDPPAKEVPEVPVVSLHQASVTRTTPNMPHIKIRMGVPMTRNHKLTFFVQREVNKDIMPSSKRFKNVYSPYWEYDRDGSYKWVYVPEANRAAEFVLPIGMDVLPLRELLPSDMRAKRPRWGILDIGNLQSPQWIEPPAGIHLKSPYCEVLRDVQLKDGVPVALGRVEFYVWIDLPGDTEGSTKQTDGAGYQMTLFVQRDKITENDKHNRGYSKRCLHLKPFVCHSFGGVLPRGAALRN